MRSGKARVLKKEGDTVVGDFVNDNLNGQGNNINQYIHILQETSSGRTAIIIRVILKKIKNMGMVYSITKMAPLTVVIGKTVNNMEKEAWKRN